LPVSIPSSAKRLHSRLLGKCSHSSRSLWVGVLGDCSKSFHRSFQLRTFVVGRLASFARGSPCGRSSACGSSEPPRSTFSGASRPLEPSTSFRPGRMPPSTGRKSRRRSAKTKRNSRGSPLFERKFPDPGRRALAFFRSRCRDDPRTGQSERGRSRPRLTPTRDCGRSSRTHAQSEGLHPVASP